MRVITLRYGMAVLMACAVNGCSSSHPSESTSRSSTPSASKDTAATKSPSQPGVPSAECQIWVKLAGRTSASEARTLASLATSPQVLQNVIRSLRLDESDQQLAARINGSVDPQTGFLVVRATGQDAVPIANADADGILYFVSREAPADQLTIVHPATLPGPPASS